MDIDDVLDLLILVASEMPKPITGHDDCDACGNVNLGYAINILRAINKKYVIASVK